MDQQDDTLDFKALRAKFQDQEILPKQPRTKPALPEKPKVVPPPQSPPHYLPAGARPSLLTSINQSLEGKTVVTPRVVFKDDKKESKKPLLQTNSKGKDKSEGKMKKSKEKVSKGGKEKLIDDSPDPKPKKDKKVKNSTAELVQATPPPKATSTKKGFLGFKKSVKRDSAEVTANPILDAPSSEVPVEAPLIPVPSGFDDTSLEPEIHAPQALLPNIPSSPDSSAVAEITLPPAIPASPEFTPAPAFIPDTPAAPADPGLEIETPPETETPAVSVPETQIEVLPNLSEAAPTPPPSSDAPLEASSPSPPEPEVDIEAVIADSIETPPPLPATDSASVTPSPKAERPISALSALERAEDMSLGKKTPPCDQRIFDALEKARKKPSSTLMNPPTSRSVTPPAEELPPPQSPTTSLPELPPIDYEDRAGQAFPQVNGLDYRQASPGLEGITEEGPDAIPELMVVPPPPPRKVLPESGDLGPAPEKPDRPPSVVLTDFVPPPLEDNVFSAEIPIPHVLTETDGMEASEFDNVASDAYSSELQVSDWGSGEYAGSCTPEPELMPEHYSNGMVTPEADAAAAPASAYGEQEPQLPESLQESPPQTEPQTQVDNDIYEPIEVNTSSTKKKGNGLKKRKGPPKNPYAEASQEPIEEKTKTGRFGKSDKKAASDGPDEKELKKKEKQRLEKEKKELKEKQEKERKEQKEREKRENEMKKKFKITGQEEAMYKAKVTVTTKGRKNDLPLKSGDDISIIRTTDCPKGKWLARDSSNNYGYVAVDHVDLDIKEMLELGKKAAVNRKSSSQQAEAEVTSMGSRASNHYPVSHESFDDDSEEWTGDEEPVSPAAEPADPLAQISHSRTLSMPDMGNKDVSIIHQHSHSDISADGTNAQARHEALQKLATFFYSPKPVEPAASSTEPETDPVLVTPEAENLSDSAYELDFDQTDMLILPPPELYADLAVE